MGLMNLLLNGMIFDCDSVLTLNEKKERAIMYFKSNDIGNSSYKTFLAEPQSAPTLFINKNSEEFTFGPQLPSIIGTDSVNYTNPYSKEITGGIVGLNSSEMDNFVIKHKF